MLGVSQMVILKKNTFSPVIGEDKVSTCDYEYKIDCLTAGIKYKKSYYSDRDIKPHENLLFTITLIPLTTYEHNAEDLVN